MFYNSLLSSIPTVEQLVPDHWSVFQSFFFVLQTGALQNKNTSERPLGADTIRDTIVLSGREAIIISEANLEVNVSFSVSLCVCILSFMFVRFT